MSELNVNLKRCTCTIDEVCNLGGIIGADGKQVHPDHCRRESAPVLVACPLPPTATFTVRLGECECERGRSEFEQHETDCPARPIRVSCSISGKTWEESEVTDCEQHGIEDFQHESVRTAAMAICREHWALVKALVSGGTLEGSALRHVYASLFAQRDAVYAALADMARAEISDHEAFLRLPLALRMATIIERDAGALAGDPRDGGVDLPSARIFARYVEHLIEQVGVLQ